MKDLQTIAGELLPVIAYGDAAGLPFEAQPPLPDNSLNKLEDTSSNPYIGRYPAGTWSDDTHLSLAVTKSLIDADGFDLASQAAWHVAALEQVKGVVEEADLTPPIRTTAKQNGWGPSTTRSVQRLQAGTSPQFSGELEGGGNGVLMKQAPLIFWQNARRTPERRAEEETVDFTRMTHQTPEATVSSLVHRYVLTELLEGSRDFAGIYSASRKRVRSYERELNAATITSEHLDRLRPALNRGELNRQSILEAAPKHGFYAPETLVMAYGSFLIHSTFPSSVFRAVELGGDADSIGSIVATMSLFRDGHIDHPHDYHRLFRVMQLGRISRRLGYNALKGGKS